MKDDEQACEYIIKEGMTAYRMSGVLRCPSLALRGSRYCAVHRKAWGNVNPPKPTPRVKRDLDLDVLPWAPTEFVDRVQRSGKRGAR